METERRRENQRTRFVLLHLPAHKSKAAVYKKKNSKYIFARFRQKSRCCPPLGAGAIFLWPAAQARGVWGAEPPSNALFEEWTEGPFLK